MASQSNTTLTRTTDLGTTNTFSSLIDREIVTRIRAFEAARAEKDRIEEASDDATERFRQASERLREALRSISGVFDDGFCIVFEGKEWVADSDNDGSPIVYANNVVVIREA